MKAVIWRLDTSEEWKIKDVEGPVAEKVAEIWVEEGKVRSSPLSYAAFLHTLLCPALQRNERGQYLLTDEGYAKVDPQGIPTMASDGEPFVLALPYILRNPYMWAEIEEWPPRDEWLALEGVERG